LKFNTLISVDGSPRSDERTIENLLR